MRHVLLALCVIAATAGSAEAQSFLENMARRAVENAAGEALRRTVTERTSPVPASTGEQEARPATRREPLRTRRDDAPEAEGMQGLSEDDRFKACSARYPIAGLSGEAWLARSSQLSACMGPNWGDGG